MEKKKGSRKLVAKALAVAAVCLITVGCTTYYRVTDLGSGTAYYTTQIKERGSGAVELTDARTGSKITLQQTEVSKINKEEYQYQLSKRPGDEKKE